MKKFLLFIVIVVAGAAGGGYWFLNSGSINELVMEQIKVQGGKVTGQAVGVAKVDIKLLEGSGAITGLTVANPPGYKQANAFSLGTIALDIDVASLTGEPYVIDALLISNPEVFVEISAKGSNLKDLYAAIEKNMPASAPVDSAADGAGMDPRIKVNSLVLEGVAMTLDLTALGNKVHSEALPRVDLGAIGGVDGLPASQLGAVIAKEITDALWDKAKDKQKEKLRDKLKEKAVDEIGKLLGKFKRG
jgi:hypothetical protein